MTVLRPSPKKLEALPESWRAEKSEKAKAELDAALAEILEADEQDLDAVLAKQAQRWRHARAFTAWIADFEAIATRQRELDAAGRRLMEVKARERLTRMRNTVAEERERLARQLHEMTETNPVAAAALEHLREEEDE